MPINSTDNLARFFDQAENTYSDDYPFLVDRLSLTIVSGTSTYALPDYVRSIRRVTYLGQKLDPLPRRNQRDVFESATQQSKPFWYVYNNLGILPLIQLFPIPDQALAPVANPWTDIVTGCIVEFNRITDNVDFILPPWIRRQLLKQYVAMKTFSVDGSGGSQKLAQYFEKRWQQRASECNELFNLIHSLPRKLIVNEITSANYYPASPVLPLARFGIAVDEGC